MTEHKGERDDLVCPDCRKKMRHDADIEAHSALDGWFAHVEECVSCGDTDCD